MKNVYLYYNIIEFKDCQVKNRISILNFHYGKDDNKETAWYTMKDEWGLFFCYVDKEEYADYIGELVRSEKGIMAAENTVRYMSEADDNWFVQNSRFIAERDKNTQIHNAEKRGREQGLQQGLQQGEQKKAAEIAKSMLSDQVSPDKVSFYSGLPLEQVLELKKQITE